MDPWSYRKARDLDLPLGKRLRSARREAGLIQSLGGAICWSFVGTYLRVAHRLAIAGSEHLPARPPFVVAANHASHLDVLCIAAALPRRLRRHAFPIAAGDTFFETPALAAFSAVFLNALPMWRRNCGRHAMAELRTRLIDDDCAFILFPEGTRSRSGEMSAFKPGLGMLVAGAAVPIVPCRIRGAFEACPPGRRWPRWSRIQLEFGRTLCFADASNEREGWERIAGAVEAAVRGLGSE